MIAGEAEIGGITVLVFAQLLLEVFQQRFAPMRPMAVGPPAEFHLQQAQIESHLKLGQSVNAHDFANVDLAGFELPVAQDRGYVLGRSFARYPLGLLVRGFFFHRSSSIHNEYNAL